MKRGRSWVANRGEAWQAYGRGAALQWFGPAPWPSDEFRAPICDSDENRIAIPVGKTCLYCDEEIREGDRGETVQYVGTDLWGRSDIKIMVSHIECSFRQVMGGPAHLIGRCRCAGGRTDPDMGMTPREAALWVWDNTTEAHSFHRYDDPPGPDQR
jgi:hypothetical protein